MKKALIFCNNNYIDFALDFPLDGTIIAADGGANFLLKRNIIPDVLIGDFDSISESSLAELKTKSDVMQFSKEKDKTDSELALDYCADQHYDTVTMINAVNGRLEHSLANIFMIEKFVQKGLSIYFINKHNEIFVLRGPQEMEMNSKRGAEISLIPLTEQVEIEFINGFKYPLQNEMLFRKQSRGVSNIAETEKLSVKILSGILLIIRGR
ncbi:MAG: thiamine diphosphokinase [Candidatus Cloacimonetes bacterium]|nr:thiamine diphosphokinase [Candidatus Cloacimonadota bacterium]